MESDGTASFDVDLDIGEHNDDHSISPSKQHVKDIDDVIDYGVRGSNDDEDASSFGVETESLRRARQLIKAHDDELANLEAEAAHAAVAAARKRRERDHQRHRRTSNTNKTQPHSHSHSRSHSRQSHSNSHYSRSQSNRDHTSYRPHHHRHKHRRRKGSPEF